MEAGWYPNNKEELTIYLKNLFQSSEERLKTLKILKDKKLRELKNFNEIHGLIVPHAGYLFCGQIMSDAFYFLENLKEKNQREKSIKKEKKAIILGTNHYFYKIGIYSHNKEYWETPLGKIKIMKNNFEKIDIKKEHSIDNQIPFIQFLSFKEILPLVINDFTNKEEEYLKKIIKEFGGLGKNCLLICSTDLSHFLDYETAKQKDIKTIKKIKKLEEEYFLNQENVACGFYPLILTIRICKHFNYKPVLINYKNSGDITPRKDSVVGYASFIF
jgi:hypothetical protein